MKITPKFQDGGFMSLFTSYTPVLDKAPSQLTRSSYSEPKLKDNTEGQLTEKDLFELVSKVDGLPNDMKSLVNNLLDMFLLQSLSGMSSISDLNSTYLSNLFLLKLANYNKKEYDKAYTQVTKNGGLNEYAITTSGGVVVMDTDNNLTQVSVHELLNNKEKYKPLTNSNLLYLRAYQPEYANRNEILNTVANGIGIDLVDKMIRSKLSTLGTSEQIRSGYSVKADGYIILGLNVLSLAESAAVAGLTGMTLDGMYKNKMITKDLKLQAEAALQYIYNTLPDNAKTLLSLKAGNSSNPEKGAIGVIFQLITSRMSSYNSSETEWEGTLKLVTKKGSGSDSDDDDDAGKIGSNPYYLMSRGMGGENTHITINKGTKYEMSVNGVLYSSIPGLNGKPIGKTSLYNALTSGLQGMVTDPKAITFGNITLSSSDLENIMIDGTAGGTVAPLPAKLSINGVKMVNLDILDNWYTANEQLKQMGINSPFDKEHQQEITKVLYENGLEEYIDMSTGEINYQAFGNFLIIDGYVVDKNNKFENSSFVTEVGDDEDEITMIEKALSTNDKLNNYSIDVDNWYDIDGHDDVYKGSIYIPITNNQLKAISASGQKIKEGPAMLKEQEWQMFNKSLKSKKPNSGMIL